MRRGTRERTEGSERERERREWRERDLKLAGTEVAVVVAQAALLGDARKVGVRQVHPGAEVLCIHACLVMVMIAILS